MNFNTFFSFFSSLLLPFLLIFFLILFLNSEYHVATGIYSLGWNSAAGRCRREGSGEKVPADPGGALAPPGALAPMGALAPLLTLLPFITITVFLLKKYC